MKNNCWCFQVACIMSFVMLVVHSWMSFVMLVVNSWIVALPLL